MRKNWFRVNSFLALSSFSWRALPVRNENHNKHNYHNNHKTAFICLQFSPKYYIFQLLDLKDLFKFLHHATIQYMERLNYIDSKRDIVDPPTIGGETSSSMTLIHTIQIQPLVITNCEADSTTWIWYHPKSQV